MRASLLTMAAITSAIRDTGRDPRRRQASAVPTDTKRILWMVLRACWNTACGGVERKLRGLRADLVDNLDVLGADLDALGTGRLHNFMPTGWSGEAWP